MKFQKIKTYALGLVIATMALTQYSCEGDWLKEYEPSKLQQPSTATVAVNTIKDSTAMLDYSLSTVGRLFVVVVPGDNETATPAASTILTLKTTGAVYKKQIILSDAAALASSVKITGLVQNTSYKVYVLPVNEDGVQGEIVTTDAFSTSDNFVPTLKLSTGVSPSISSVASQNVNFKPVLTFSEPVVLAETFNISVSYYNSVTAAAVVVAVPKDSIKINSNKVTIGLPVVPLNGQRLGLTIGAGSFTDRTGNAYEGTPCNITTTPYTGIYWRVKLAATSMQQILPADSITTNTALKILVDFPLQMRKPNSAIAGEGAYDPAKIVVKYTSAGITSEMQVPGANVTIIRDTLVQITLPRTPAYGETVTFMMAEGAMRNSYGNPSAAIAFGTKSWFFSYGYSRSLILGNYTIGSLVSQFDGAVSTQYHVVISAHATDAKKVVISGMLGSQDNIIADFNGDMATLTINKATESMGQMLTFAAGHPLAGLKIEVWNGYTGANGIAKGTINSVGRISMPGLGFYYYSLTDPTDEDWYDLYSQSIWTKDAVKAVNYVENFQPVVSRGLNKNLK